MATTQEPPVEIERVACEICLREVPNSEALVPEAADYVAYFFGLHCYELWKSLPENPQPEARADCTRA